jgi:hypothetical protein
MPICLPPPPLFSGKPRLTAGVIALLWCMTAHGGTRWDFSGFGSVGGQRWYGDRYTTEYNEPPSDEFDADWDSILGAQLSVANSNGLGFTAQGVARGYSPAGDPPYQPVTEWFFGSWQATDALKIRVGRLRTPLFMYSESLEIGYSYPWVEPNRHVYKTTYSVASKYDGADVSFTHLLGSALITYQALAGSSKSVFLENPAELDKARGMTVTAIVDTATLRYAYIRNQTTIENDNARSVAQYLRTQTALSPGLGEVAESLDTTDIPQSTHEIGLRWELDEYTIDAEAIYSPSPGEQLDLESFGTYVGLARQFDSHTVFGVVGYSSIVLRNNALSILASTKNDIPPGTDLLLDAIRQQLATTLDGYTAKDSSITVGYRYEITESWNLKTEVRRIWLDEDFSPDAYITPPATPEQGKAHIVRIVTDWVF